MPEGLESIGAFAFSECSKMESIVIPHSVTSLGRWAFNGCTRSITYNGVTYTDKAVFNAKVKADGLTTEDDVWCPYEYSYDY